mmetsp:Transcript_17904/g.21924  ORF Transcript_17904/g.21924 Transcript_17904/m.21924 type:complete len:487 (-) Transcript_17904:111-1571(-)
MEDIVRNDNGAKVGIKKCNNKILTPHLFCGESDKTYSLSCNKASLHDESGLAILGRGEKTHFEQSIKEGKVCSEASSNKKSCKRVASGIGEKQNKPKNRRTSTYLSFPEKLMSILESGIIPEEVFSWVADGTAFVIKDPKRFTLEVLPQYFKQSEFSSFTRKLYYWGFRKVTKTEESGNCFRHDLFIRGKYDLCRLVRTCSKLDQVPPKFVSEKKDDFESSNNLSKGAMEILQPKNISLSRENKHYEKNSQALHQLNCFDDSINIQRKTTPVDIHTLNYPNNTIYGYPNSAHQRSMHSNDISNHLFTNNCANFRTQANMSYADRTRSHSMITPVNQMPNHTVERRSIGSDDIFTRYCREAATQAVDIERNRSVAAASLQNAIFQYKKTIFDQDQLQKQLFVNSAVVEMHNAKKIQQHQYFQQPLNPVRNAFNHIFNSEQLVPSSLPMRGSIDLQQHRQEIQNNASISSILSNLQRKRGNNDGRPDI